MLKELSILAVSLDNSILIFSKFIKSISAEDIITVRHPGFWSIEKHIFHLADSQEWTCHILEAFKDKAGPELVIYGRDIKAGPAVKSYEEALSVFCDLRRKQIEIIYAYEPADLIKEIELAYFLKKITPEMFIRYTLFHDNWHMYRMSELLLYRDEYLKEA